MQMVKAWEGLPVWLGGRDGVEVEACEAVRGHVGNQLDVVSELQKEQSFIGHVTVPCAPPAPPAPPASAPSPSAGAEAARSAGAGGDAGVPREGGLAVCDAEGFWGPHGSRGGGGLRRGMWVRRARDDGEGRGGNSGGGWGGVPASPGHAEAAASPPASPSAADPRAQALEGRAEDECPLVAGGWEWQPAGCVLPSATERDCEACWRGLQRVRFAGDSNCRDIYVEAASCVLGDWDPDVPVAREQTKHSNASVLLPSGGALDFVWCTHLDQVTAAATALLQELQYRMELLQHQAGSSGAGGGEESVGKDSVLVVGFGIWDVVVHLTPLQSMVHKLEPLLEVLGALRELGVSVVWLTPIPRTLMKRGILAGEKDVKVSYWRLRRWAHQLSRLMQARGVAVVDSLHAPAALPEAFDGNHLGIACGWAGTSQSSDRIAGKAGVCRHNARLLARTVLRMLMGGLCPALPAPTRHLVRVLPVSTEHVSVSATPSSSGSAHGAGSGGLVRQLRVSLLDGGRPGGDGRARGQLEEGNAEGEGGGDRRRRGGGFLSGRLERGRRSSCGAARALPTARACACTRDRCRGRGRGDRSSWRDGTKVRDTALVAEWGRGRNSSALV